MKRRGFDTAFHAEARLCGLTLRAAKQLIKMLFETLRRDCRRRIINYKLHKRDEKRNRLVARPACLDRNIESSDRV